MSKIDGKKLANLVGKYMPKEVSRNEEGNIQTPRFETGVEGFDALLGGGIPKGHMISISTEEGGGKSTLAAQVCGNIIEKYGVKVYYFDVERGVTPELLSSMGYAQHLYHPEHNPDGKFIRLQTRYIQEIAEVYKEILADPETGVIVIDSTTATEDRRLTEDATLGLDKNSVGAHARMWSQGSRTFNALLADTNISCIMIHQAREDLSGFFVKTTAARGRALKHYVSVEVFGTIGKWLDADGNEVKSRQEAKGATLRLTTTKNRLTRPYAQVRLPLFFGRGVSNKWAYKEWLENFQITDPVTGEVTTALEIKGGGYANLNLPSGQYKVRGAVQINEAIDTHINEILEFIHANGGLNLDLTSEE